MIRKIRLVDFQKYKDYTAEFDPAVSVFCGETNAGKSTILRALLFVAFNSVPKGMVRHGADFARVTVWVDDHKVVRVKGKHKNVYVLDGKVFKAFGTGVPPPIAAVFNISELSVQKQIDPPFWFTESAGQVSRNLNQIVNLGDIDAALSNTKSELHRLKVQSEIVGQRMKEAKSERDSSAWSVECSRLADGLVRTQERIDRETATTRRLAFLCRGVADASEGIDRATETTVAGCNAVRLGSLHAGERAKTQRLKQLIELIRTADAVAKTELPDIGPLLALRERADKAAEDRRRLEELTVNLTRVEDELCRSQSTLDELSLKLSKIAICPTCGRPIVKTPSSRNSSPTCTSGTSHRSPVRMKTIGTR